MLENQTISFVRFKDPALKNKAWSVIEKVHFWVQNPNQPLKPYVEKKAELYKDFFNRHIVWDYADDQESWVNKSANIQVFWRPGLGLPESTTFDWKLVFGGGKSKVVKVKFNSQKYERLLAQVSFA